MNLGERLRDLTRVYLDASPVIYQVENHPKYIVGLDFLFERLDQQSLIGVTSPITLAECLIYPMRNQQPDLQQRFRDAITRGLGVEFVEVNESVSLRAAELRVKYGLALLDALHAGVALESGCDAIVTNDHHFRRLDEIEVIMLNDIVETA